MNFAKHFFGRLPAPLVVHKIPWWFLQSEITINPVQVKKIITSNNTTNLKFSGMLFSDSTSIECINNDFMHTTIEEIYIDKKHFTETKQYNRMIHAVNRFQKKEITDPSLHGGYWCKTECDVNRYFDDLDQTFKSIKASGYKSQTELISAGSNLVKGRGFDDLKFLIDADGSVVFFANGGNHRFSICRLLSISRLKGVLVGIHRNFYRENILGNSSYNNFINSIRLVI